MSLKDKVLALQLNAELKKVAYIMPKEDRELFETTCDKEKEILIEILEAGIPLKRMQDLMTLIATKQFLLKKHKLTYQKRIKGK